MRHLGGGMNEEFCLSDGRSVRRVYPAREQLQSLSTTRGLLFTGRQKAFFSICLQKKSNGEMK